MWIKVKIYTCPYAKSLVKYFIGTLPTLTALVPKLPNTTSAHIKSTPQMPNQLFNFLLRQQAAVANNDEAINPIDILFEHSVDLNVPQAKPKKVWIDCGRVEGDQRLYSDYFAPQPV